MKISAVQISVEIGKIEENVKKAISFSDEAVKQGADLICLPEMFNTGYFCHTSHVDNSYFGLAEPITGRTIKQFQSFAKQNKVIMIVPFYEYLSPGIFFNSACVIDESGKVLGCYRKTHIGWSGTGWEKYYCRPGNEFPVFETSLGKIGILICYDRDFPEVARTLCLKGAEILCIPNGASISLQETWKCILKTRAYENQVFVIGSCFTGRTDEEHHEFCGNSIVVDPFGNEINSLDREEGILISDIDLNQINQARIKRFMCRDRRPELYSTLSILNNEI